MKNSNNRKTILWWGRFSPEYSRTSILRKILSEEGWNHVDFHPKISQFGYLESFFNKIRMPNIIWVPCCRQRDVRSAYFFSKKYNIPLIFDPLISSYDKKVFERKKFSEKSYRAKKIKNWEQKIFKSADIILADTILHKEFYSNFFDIDNSKIFTVSVGADEELFFPKSFVKKEKYEVLFYGTFLELHGIEFIIEASKLLDNVNWVILGDGKLKKLFLDMGKGLSNLRFENKIEYTRLPSRIAKSDILLGIFADSYKASRVIPNKFYQSIACARPVITRDSCAYPNDIRVNSNKGIFLVPHSNPQKIAEMVKKIISDDSKLHKYGNDAFAQYCKYFNGKVVKKELLKAIEHLYSKGSI